LSSRPRSRSRSAIARFDELLTAILVVAILLLAVVYLPSDARRTYSGLAHVLDGDSLVVGTVETRLKGIDAPELGQFCLLDGKPWHCGEAAKSALHGAIAGRNVTCDGEGRDAYDRVIAVCRVGDRELNKEMVEKGWAVAYGSYQAQEKVAKIEEQGIWASEFDRPALWREMFKGT
jgi:endonuclease YncB( thermonuclease family)